MATTSQPSAPHAEWSRGLVAALSPLLSADGWELVGGEARGDGLPAPCGVARRGDTELLFYRGPAPAERLRDVALAIRRPDGDQFRQVAVLVVATRAELAAWRRPAQCANWPRGLFLCEEDVCQPTPAASLAAVSRAVAGMAEVVANVPIGVTPGRHCQLRLRAPSLGAIVPGQFLMLATAPELPPPPATPRPLVDVSAAALLAPHSYLKRPFGIQRAHYPQFPPDLLRRLVLPPALASCLWLPAPDEFDLFYKVLPAGVGTHELAVRQPGDRLPVLGPLGTGLDARTLRAAGVREVHVVGGGCGIAPLVFLVAALRWCALPVKVFVGVETLSGLEYPDGRAPCLAGDPGAVCALLDDLRALGVSPADLVVTVDRAEAGDDARVAGLASRLTPGLVSTAYAEFLRRRPPGAGVLAVSCGPWPMLKAVRELTVAHGIPLRVLLEKRMACGIGVCLSCVCKTRNHEGAERYARVCTEGPLFDAAEVVWD